MEWNRDGLSPWLLCLGCLCGGNGGGGHISHEGTQGGVPKGPSWRVGEDKTTTPYEDTELGDSMEQN